MATICRSYASHGEAREAVEAALGAGIDGGAVLVLTGERTPDAGQAPVGGFAGTKPDDFTVGSFADEPVPHEESKGAFAPGVERTGSFADTDREFVTSYPEGVERMHVAGHHHLLRLLEHAGLDEATAARHLDELHSGRVVVLVDVPDGDAERVGALLER